MFVNILLFLISSQAFGFVPSEKYILKQMQVSRTPIKLVTMRGTIRSLKGLPAGSIDEEWTIDAVKQKSYSQFFRSGTREVVKSRVGQNLSALSAIGKAWYALGLCNSSATSAERVNQLLADWVTSEHKVSLRQEGQIPFFQIGDAETNFQVTKVGLKPRGLKGKDGSILIRDFSSDGASISVPKTVIVSSGDIEFSYELKEFKVGRAYVAGESASGFADPGLVETAEKIIAVAR